VFFFTSNSSSILIDSLVGFNTNALLDPHVAALMAYAYDQKMDEYGRSVELVHGKALADPPIFQNFTGVSSIAASVQTTDLTQLVLDMNASNPGGFRYAL
jgi:hypothetical protein